MNRCRRRSAVATAAVPTGVEEVVVVGTRIRGYIGCRSLFCRRCDHWWTYRSEDDVCALFDSYLKNSDGNCYTCELGIGGGIGGGGGGGGNVERDDEDDSDEDECDPGEATRYHHDVPTVERVATPLADVGAWGVTRLSVELDHLKCVEVCPGQTYRIDGDAITRLSAQVTTVIAPTGGCTMGQRTEHHILQTIAHEEKHLRAYVGAIDALETHRKDFDTQEVCEQSAKSMRNALDRTIDILAWGRFVFRVRRELPPDDQCPECRGDREVCRGRDALR